MQKLTKLEQRAILEARVVELEDEIEAMDRALLQRAEEIGEVTLECDGLKDRLATVERLKAEEFKAGAIQMNKVVWKALALKAELDAEKAAHAALGTLFDEAVAAMKAVKAERDELARQLSASGIVGGNGGEP